MEPCVQDRVIGEIQTTLNYFKEAEIRREGREERMLIAMENVAKQGAIIDMHTVHIDKQSRDLAEAFGLIRLLEQSTASEIDMDIVKNRIGILELKQAEDFGAYGVTERTTKFWDGVKQQFTPYVLVGMMIILYLIDRFNVAQGFLKLWKDFK